MTAAGHPHHSDQTGIPGNPGKLAGHASLAPRCSSKSLFVGRSDTRLEAIG